MARHGIGVAKNMEAIMLKVVKVDHAFGRLGLPVSLAKSDNRLGQLHHQQRRVKFL